MVKREPPKFLWGAIPIKAPRAISTRGGTSFWIDAGLDGVKSIVLTVPSGRSSPHPPGTTVTDIADADLLFSTWLQ